MEVMSPPPDRLVFTAGCTEVQDWRGRAAGGEEHQGRARGAPHRAAAQTGTARPAGERHFGQGRNRIWPQQLFNNDPSDAQEHMRISRVQKEIEQWRTDPPLTSGAQMELPVFPG